MIEVGGVQVVGCYEPAAAPYRDQVRDAWLHGCVAALPLEESLERGVPVLVVPLPEPTPSAVTLAVHLFRTGGCCVLQATDHDLRSGHAQAG